MSLDNNHDNWMDFMNLRKVTKVTEDWNKLRGLLNVKFNEKSGWFRFGGVKNGMFVLLDRKGEEFRTNQIFVSC